MAFMSWWSVCDYLDFVSIAEAFFLFPSLSLSPSPSPSPSPSQYLSDLILSALYIFVKRIIWLLNLKKEKYAAIYLAFNGWCWGGELKVLQRGQHCVNARQWPSFDSVYVSGSKTRTNDTPRTTSIDASDAIERRRRRRRLRKFSFPSARCDSRSIPVHWFWFEPFRPNIDECDIGSIPVIY